MFSDKIINFNKTLEFTGKLPPGIRVMNPFKNNQETLSVSKQFYKKFYSDNLPRKLILGINPGRLGAGVTGIPFTDSKRLAEYCGINIRSVVTHEPSSVFIYEVIKQYGGVKKFFTNFYINSVCPLGFIGERKSGNWNNLNYYDYPSLIKITRPFIVYSLKMQIKMGIDTSIVYILGTKNGEIFKKINDEYRFFDSIIILEHPRYIEQYKSKIRHEFVLKYLNALKGTLANNEVPI